MVLFFGSDLIYGRIVILQLSDEIKVLWYSNCFTNNQQKPIKKTSKNHQKPSTHRLVHQVDFLYPVFQGGPEITLRSVPVTPPKVVLQEVEDPVVFNHMEVEMIEQTNDQPVKLKYEHSWDRTTWAIFGSQKSKIKWIIILDALNVGMLWSIGTVSSPFDCRGFEYFKSVCVGEAWSSQFFGSEHEMVVSMHTLLDFLHEPCFGMFWWWNISIFPQLFPTNVCKWMVWPQRQIGYVGLVAHHPNP